MGAKILRLLFILVISTAQLAQLTAYQFSVGGKEGWVVSPSENYNHWAERMRFQVNDTLFFGYKKGTDSVLVVNQGDYDKCNTQNPITTLDGGDSIFKFDRSGPFFFISGIQDQCNKGQKLIIVVLAVRQKSSPPGPVVKSPAPAPQTEYESPSPSPSPTPSPSSPESSLTPTVPSPGSSRGGTSGSAMSPPRSGSSMDSVTPSVIFISAVTFVWSFA